MDDPVPKLSFKCQMSGKCCVSHDDHGFVYLTPQDRIRLSLHLRQNESEFTEVREFDYTRFKKGKSRQWILKNDGGKCRFIKNGKCSVYEARPTQCRSWPFYPEHMEAKAWTLLSKFCPGVGKGELRSKEEVEKILNEQREADLILSIK